MTHESQVHPDAELSVEQVRELEYALDDARETLLATAHGTQRDQAGDPNCFVDEGDAATAARELDRSRKRSDHQGRQLVEVEAALERIRTGTYGVCEGTGDPIGFGRLQALPWARLCAAAQEDQE